jgi:hypothetical protein
MTSPTTHNTLPTDPYMGFTKTRTLPSTMRGGEFIRYGCVIVLPDTSRNLATALTLGLVLDMCQAALPSLSPEHRLEWARTYLKVMAEVNGHKVWTDVLHVLAGPRNLGNI